MATTYLTRQISTAGSRRKATISLWVKRGGTLDSDQRWFSYENTSVSNNVTVFKFSGDSIQFADQTGGSNNARYDGTRKLRDCNGWYHFLVKMDTTQATNTDRLKVYINGELQSEASYTYPSQNADLNIGHNSNAYIDIGRWRGSNNQYFDGLITHFHYTDGYAYDASDFGETDSTSGIWKPKTAPSVTYGTNGFFLKFENSGAMGTDSSGNSNTFTPAGTLTQNADTPSNNFAVFNRNDRHGGATNNYGDYLTNGNTKVTIASAQKGCLRSILGVSSGKWYWEAKVISKEKGFYGICNDEAFKTTSASIQGTTTASGVWFYDNGPYYYAFNHQNNNTSIDSTANNDILCFALDMDNHAFYIRKNDNAWMNSGDPASGASRTGSIPELFTNGRNVLTDNGAVFINHYVDSSSGGSTAEYNFGNGYFGTTAVASANADGNGFGAFEYTVPTGYYALCTKNLKEFG